MRKLIALLMLCLPVMAFAQKRNLEPENISPKAPLYILDGKESTEDGIKTVVPDSILRIDVIKDLSGPAMYGSKALNGVVLITSRNYGVKQYRELLSTFSNDVKAWLASDPENDGQLRYFVDGTEVPKTDAGRNNLYDLKKNNITAVTLIKDEPAGSNYTAKIKIVTKR